MEYAKNNVFEVEYKENRTSSKFFKIILSLTIILSTVNCIFIYDFFKILSKM